MIFHSSVSVPEGNISPGQLPSLSHPNKSPAPLRVPTKRHEAILQLPGMFLVPKLGIKWYHDHIKNTLDIPRQYGGFHQWRYPKIDGL